MKKKDLHDVIQDVLKTSGKPLPLFTVTKLIEKDKLWYRPKDGFLPRQTQISARINKYPNLFLKKNGVVQLKNDDVETKITRLTFNNRGWIEPSGWERKSRTPGLHESEHGFGHEEWLFDFDHLIKGYRYGFIEGLRTKNNKHGGCIYNMQLFTIDGVEKQKYWVAKINNCYVLTEGEQIRIQKEFSSKGWIKESEDQLKELGLWNRGSKRSLNTFGPNVKFLEQDVVFYDPPITIPYSKYISNRDRYLLYDWDITAKIATIQGFEFSPSKPNSNKKVWRINTPEFKSKEIRQVHKQIAEALYLELSNKYGIQNICCDLANNQGTYIDMVRKDGNKYVFYEIKTYNQLRKNIREALGQLLEYAFWNRNKAVKEIIIVSDKKLDNEAFEYLSCLNQTFNIPISYLQQIIK
jgi:hypothetical protein